MDLHIYLIHNIVNNKVYVGKTKNPEKRWDKHLKIAAGERQEEKFFIHRAIAKYGADNFVFSIVQKLSKEADACAAETYWIGYFRSRESEYGYNLTDGGEGVSGRIVSEATRQKMREKATGRKHTQKTRELLSQINIGKIPSNLEQLKTMNIGKQLSSEHKQKISEGRTGMIFTEEHRKNMSLARIGAGIGKGNPFYGKSHTEETKELSRGENNKRSKLTAFQVMEILENKNNYTQQKLADEYGVSRGAIRHILNGTTWAHLPRKIHE